MIKKIGNPEILFEIVDNSAETRYLYIRISINGKIVGTLESPTYLPSFLSSLKSILSDDYYFNGDVNNSNYKSFFIVNGHITNNYRITLEETFDDYEKRVIRNNNFIFFYFNNYEDGFFEYDVILNNVFEVITIENYRLALSELCDYIELKNKV